MKTPDDPKKVLTALLERTALPFDAKAVLAAQAMAMAPQSATSAAMEALPELLALAVLEAATRAKLPELAFALQDCSNKAIAKGAKKALYAMRSAGVQVPERVRPPEIPAAAPAPEETDEWVPSWLSPPAGTGERALLMVRPQKGGGLEVAQLMISDEHGVVQCQSVESNRSSYRKQVRELRAEVPQRAIEISLEEAKSVLAESAALNAATGAELPDGTDQVLRHFGVKAGRAPEDLPPPQPEDERTSAQGQTLHAEPEVQPWLPPEAQLKVLSQRIDAIVKSPLELTQAQKDEQVRAALRTSAAEFFTPQIRKVFGRRLWHLANYLERTARAEKAAIARAEARRVFHNAPTGATRFEEFLFEKVLILSQIIQRGQKLPEAPGAVVPEVSKATEPSGEHKSPGGIILP